MSVRQEDYIATMGLSSPTAPRGFLEATPDAIVVVDTASHELKTPLTPLQLQLDTLAKSLEQSGVQDESVSNDAAEQLKAAGVVKKPLRLNQPLDAVGSIGQSGDRP